MAALGSARRFVGKGAQPFELVTRHFIGHRLQGAGVEGAGHSITSIRAAIEKRFEVHRGDSAVLLDAGLDVHEDGVPAAMTIENFFAGQRHLYGPAGNHRQLANYNFVIEGIALAAKAAAIRRGNHSNMTRRHFEHFG